ncbi:MAG: RIP metalloprotease RseP [Blautia sp.]
MKIVIALLIFSAIVLFHELGHFLLAKKNHVVVTEFSLGMGPRLISTTRGETRYSLKLLPFGGSCAMLGEDGEDASPGTFNGASVWARMSIVAAGPIFNFVLAFFMALIIIAKIGYVPASVVEFEKGSPAQEMGLKEGDIIKEFNGYHVDIGNDIYTYLTLNELKNEPITIVYERDGKEHTITYDPMVEKNYLLGFQRTDTSSMVVETLMPNMPLGEAGVKEGDVITGINGVTISDGDAYTKYIEEHPLTGDPVEITYERDGLSYHATITPRLHETVSMDFYYNLGSVKTSGWNVVKYSVIEVKYWIRTTVLSLGKLITGQFGVKDLSGPVGVVDVIGETYEESQSMGTTMVWMNMLNIAILLSANLGVMNLLPVPALDGGRLVFFIIEAIRRKPVNRQVEGMVHFVGFMFLMALMVVVMYNDIVKIF